MNLYEVARRTACVFHRRFGGDLEEQQSEAYLATARTAARFDPARGSSAEGWLVFCVWRQLSHQRRHEQRYRQHEHASNHEQACQTLERSRCNVPQLLHELSPAAADILQQQLDDPRAVRPEQLRAHQRRRGWSSGTITLALTELREALA